MSRAQATREKIIRLAAELFNQQGYSGASMSDLMRATGLQKGGIYNHFKSKDDLALEAFDFAIQQTKAHILRSLEDKQGAIARLQALVENYRDYWNNPPISGGCPLLNTAVDSDDAHPALRSRAQTAMDEWRSLIRQIVQQGITAGEISSAVDADGVATIMIATIEGGIMMSKLYGDRIHLERALDHLDWYIENQLVMDGERI
ncbi:MAG: TetR/AcrR family transcriptional regulator [Cyanothece sp. SIO1E1]|nr:TetR/AcrR family transcriptional regulator [Cyanothece sp. SIO1E1]